MYDKLGFLTGSAEFPAVARFAALAGPADSAFVLLTISIPNSALRFQRAATGFSAGYRVQTTLRRGSDRVHSDRRENVHVRSFAETSRSEESVIFQESFAVAPGTYSVDLRINDSHSDKKMSAHDTVFVPSFPAEQTLATPLFVHTDKTRTARAELPAFLVNTRNTVAYGAQTPQLYLELYGAVEPESVNVRVVDEDNAALWSSTVYMANGDAGLRAFTMPIPADSLPIGRVWIETSSAGTKPIRMPMLVTISDDWLIGNFDEMLLFMRYIAYPAEINGLRDAVGVERNRLWENFWSRRDSSPGTPDNEFRKEFFRRVRFAIEELHEPGRPGWRTERGEVYIVLGAPGYIRERQVSRSTIEDAVVLDWVYEDAGIGRDLVLRFIDRNGFGQFELSQSARIAFTAAVQRARPK